MAFNAPILESNFITIEGFDNLSPQEAFDMSAKHILSNGPSFNSKLNACRYGGSGCAAAVFIREEFRDIADRKAGQWLSVAATRLASITNIDLIMSLQNAHDDSVEAALDMDANGIHKVVNLNNFFTRWVHTMREVAAKYNLNTEVLDTAK